MKTITVLISGSGSNLEAIINACDTKKINGEVISVISNNHDAYGLTRAKKFNINTAVIDHRLYTNREDFDLELESLLDQLDSDLIILAGFMRILGEKITKKFGNKMINLHPSLLPLYPGLNTHKKVLDNKDKNHGVSIHYVSGELDGGPLIAQGIIKVKKNDNLDSLINRIHKIEHILLPEIIKQICLGNISLNGDNVFYNNIKLLDKGLIRITYEI